VKIREKERLEPPHVSIIRRTKTWRIDLRHDRFLESEPPPRGVPAVLRQLITDSLPQLCEAWDRMYPENPVGSTR
jgi:hypothetical protein